MVKSIKQNHKNRTYKNHTHKIRNSNSNRNHNHILLPNKTPYKDNKLSHIISTSLKKHINLGYGLGLEMNIGEGPPTRIRDLSSYSPTINDNLISLKSSTREKVIGCNLKRAFSLKEPLQIKIGSTCYLYSDPLAKDVFLHNLAANKHINVKKIIPPIQILSNCWFNTMFCAFFISDKGRKFFHYFRQLMIEGRTADKHKIQPHSLRDAFALLNFAIESALLGTSYAYELDTNSIIKIIHDIITSHHKHRRLFSTNTNPFKEYIVPVDNASNPIRYYEGIIHYLHNKSIQLLSVSVTIEKMHINSNSIVNIIQHEIDNGHDQDQDKGHFPHIIVVEIFDGSNKSEGDSGKINNRPLDFKLSKDVNYILDSCIIRDTYQNHFCAMLTCEGKEMGYDGMSFHRLVPMKWKKHLNSSTKWSFEGSVDNGRTLEWSFKHGYQMLIYYRA